MLVLMLFRTTVSKLRLCLGNSCFIPEAGAASTVAMSMKAATAAMMRGRKVLLESILVVIVIRMKMGKERRGAVFKHFEFFLFWYGYSWVDFLVANWRKWEEKVCCAWTPRIRQDATGWAKATKWKMFVPEQRLWLNPSGSLLTQGDVTCACRFKTGALSVCAQFLWERWSLTENSIMHAQFPTALVFDQGRCPPKIQPN